MPVNTIHETSGDENVVKFKPKTNTTSEKKKPGQSGANHTKNANDTVNGTTDNAAKSDGSDDEVPPRVYKTKGANKRNRVARVGADVEDYAADSSSTTMRHNRKTSKGDPTSARLKPVRSFTQSANYKKV